MNSLKSSLLVAGILALTGAPLAALAQNPLPPTRSVFVQTHADPEDAESPIVTLTEIRIAPLVRDGNEVVWSAQWVAITLFDEYGEVVESWLDESPEFSTGDGHWHVPHANPEVPTPAEFALLPLISGTAQADISENDALNYMLEGVSVGSPNSPHAITAIMDYSFQRTEDPEPVDDDDDEPAGISDDGFSAG